ncbi:MAG: hemagglutinin repeat-containing protein [Phascolarctobacterium faecium]
MQLQAGGDLALTGSHVTATDSITATAGGGIELEAVKDRKMEEAEIGHRGGFYYNRVMTDDEKVQGSSMLPEAISACKVAGISTLPQ